MLRYSSSVFVFLFATSVVYIQTRDADTLNAGISRDFWRALANANKVNKMFDDSIADPMADLPEVNK
jgi:hypothetical protein